MNALSSFLHLNGDIGELVESRARTFEMSMSWLKMVLEVPMFGR